MILAAISVMKTGTSAMEIGIRPVGEILGDPTEMTGISQNLLPCQTSLMLWSLLIARNHRYVILKNRESLQMS